MIPTLYDKTGAVKIGDLTDTIECLVEEERNGLFELTMVYPATDSIVESIQQEAIVVADANDYLKNQKFRIYNIRKLMANRIEICARHISFDLAFDWVDSISIENQSCEYALNTIFKNSQFCKNFKGYSDIINAQDYKMNKATCLEAIGGERGSIIDTFGTGAEILRDNTEIHVLNRRGRDNDVVIEYRKNLTGLEIEEDTTDLVTRIMPYAVYTSEDNEEVEVRGDFVDSPLINNFAHPYVKYIDYSDKFEDDEKPTKEKLIELAKKEYINNKLDIPKCNFKIEFIPLSKCVGYEGLEDRINLCDTVTVKDTRYGLDTQAKVIKVTYNTLRDRYESMELGEPRTSLGDIIGNGGIWSVVYTQDFFVHVRFAFRLKSIPEGAIVKDCPDVRLELIIKQIRFNVGFTADPGDASAEIGVHIQDGNACNHQDETGQVNQNSQVFLWMNAVGTHEFLSFLFTAFRSYIPRPILL